MDTYEKKYNEALERAKELLDSPRTCFDIVQLKDIFTELRESEDEKIYREIYSIVHHSYQEKIDNLVSQERKKEQLDKWEKAKDWLERQKEQKPDIEICPHSIKSKSYSITGYPCEWSEEDEKIRRNLMSLLVNMRGDRITEETYQKYYPWIKNLPIGWKPSEEQLNALNFAITYFMHETNYKNPTELRELYDDLLKLK